jgi:hypothetical protein
MLSNLIFPDEANRIEDTL